MIEIMFRELSDHKWSLLAYCVVALGLLWLYVSLFPSIQQQSAELTKAFAAYPKQLFEAFGIESLNFDSIEKYLALEQFSFMWQIIMAMLAVSRAGGAIAGEVEKRTIGLYLSLPISRANVFLAKYFASLVNITIFTAVSTLGVIPLASLYGINYHVDRFVSLAVLSVLFGWAVMAYGMLLSAIFNEKGRVYAVAAGTLVLMYASNVVASLQDNLRWLHKVSVFYFYNAQDILTKHELNTLSFIVLGAAIGAFTLLGMWRFVRRDVAA